ncbi:MAG: hypothetical protein U0984_01835, partial [Prosthecobacter sp.]|nr:hypothetical protein [Prosthecobacter sp.]
MQTVSHRSWRPFFLGCCLWTFVCATDGGAPPRAVPVEDVTPETPLPVTVKKKTSLSASLLTQKEARTMRLS